MLDKTDVAAGVVVEQEKVDAAGETSGMTPIFQR